MSSSCLLLSLLLNSTGFAQDAVQLEVVRKGQKGQSKPGLIVMPQVAANDLNVRVDCGGAWAERAGPATAGERIQMDLDASEGTHSCTGQLVVTLSDGTTGEMPISFEIEMLPPLGIEVFRDTVNTAEGRLNLVLDRVAGEIEVVAIGLGGTDGGRGVTPVSGHPAGSPIEVEWAATGAEVLQLQIRATDADGFWSAVELYPWYYEIPHEDVVFETGKAEVQLVEEGKLRAALSEVHHVLNKYGDQAVVKLYVGGYTDTVGSPTQNQKLSELRAAAIAQWFKTNGFTGKVFYQGFGEKGLTVHTPDEVDEGRNRRAAYILAAEPPPVSKLIPAQDWVAIY